LEKSVSLRGRLSWSCWRGVRRSELGDDAIQLFDNRVDRATGQSMTLPSAFEPDAFFRRVFALNNMDRESAVWQFTNMYFNPSAVRRIIAQHKHAKGTWGRDDPAFLLIETGIMAGLALLWYILPFTPFSSMTLVRSLSTFVIFDFFILGLISSTLLWVLLNKWGKVALAAHRSDEDVEWRYCFDVFCNSFIAVIVDIDLGFIIVAILGLISKGWLVQVFIPNTLLFVGVVHFVLLAIPLILILPFVKKFGIGPPLIAVFVLYVISLLFSFEGGKRWISFHFSVR
jgi:hypothetical protein